MKMKDVFKLPMLCEDGDSSIYSKDLRHYIMFDDSDTHMMDHKKAVAHAINNHDRLVNLETDRKNAISKMSKSWQHNADDNDDLLTRFVEMANRQFEERDRLREFVEMVADGDNCEESDKLLAAHCFIETAKQLLNGETK